MSSGPGIVITGYHFEAPGPDCYLSKYTQDGRDHVRIGAEVWGSCYAAGTREACEAARRLLFPPAWEAWQEARARHYEVTGEMAWTEDCDPRLAFEVERKRADKLHAEARRLWRLEMGAAWVVVAIPIVCGLGNLVLRSTVLAWSAVGAEVVAVTAMQFAQRARFRADEAHNKAWQGALDIACKLRR